MSDPIAPPGVPREILAHDRVCIAPAGSCPPRADVVQDATLSVGARLTWELIALQPVIGAAGRRDLRLALGVAKERVIAYLDELHRRGLIDAEVLPT